MKKRYFGKIKNGEEAYVYKIQNQKGMKAEVTEFGAALVSLYVRDKYGADRDVILGYDSVEKYESEDCHFGAIIGRNANRIKGAKVTIDGVEYLLERNANQDNLHSGSRCLSKKMWAVKEVTDSKLTFSVISSHLEQGFPGNLSVEVSYEISEDNELIISFTGATDKKTVCNMTNHAYFNLEGHDAGTVYRQRLKINASAYTPVKSKECVVPTGEIRSVENTPFDFRQEKEIGRDLVEDQQLQYGNGYDHNFVLDRQGKGVERAAEAYAPESGIKMEVFTDCPGVQLYTANYTGGQVGKGGTVYVSRGAYCLETQYFPNAVNEKNFESPLLDVGEVYSSKTIFRFFAEDASAP